MATNISNMVTTSINSSNTNSSHAQQQRRQQLHGESQQQQSLLLRCDICQMKPNFKKMTMLTCRVCHVHVHRECYEGISIVTTTTTADDNNNDNNDDENNVLNPQHQSNDFICYACQAVGQHIVGRKRIKIGLYRTMKIYQKERPMECCLCSSSSGSSSSSSTSSSTGSAAQQQQLHAMHPLYDHFGKWGRQIILPTPTTTSTHHSSNLTDDNNNNHDRNHQPQHQQPEERLAWVHSLCAYAICSLKLTAGCVYGCNRLGQYQNDHGQFTDNEADIDDALSVNSALVAAARAKRQPTDNDNDVEEDDDDLSRITHFVYCLPTIHGKTDAWTERIAHFQQKSKCTICGLSDASKYSLRIPFQCRANEEDEHAQFLAMHMEMADDEFCTQAMHIGCAMWGCSSSSSVRSDGRPNNNNNHNGSSTMAPPQFRRVYYYPGNLDPQYPEPVVEVYCTAHARDIHFGRINRGKLQDNNSNSTLVKRNRNYIPTTTTERKAPAAAGGGHRREVAKITTRTKKPATIILPPTREPPDGGNNDRTDKSNNNNNIKPHPHAQRSHNNDDRSTSAIRRSDAAATTSSMHPSATRSTSCTTKPITPRPTTAANLDTSTPVFLDTATSAVMPLGVNSLHRSASLPEASLSSSASKLTSLRRRFSADSAGVPSLNSGKSSMNPGAVSSMGSKSTIPTTAVSIPLLSALPRKNHHEKLNNNINNKGSERSHLQSRPIAPPPPPFEQTKQGNSRKRKNMSSLLPRADAIPLGKKMNGKKGKRSQMNSVAAVAASYHGDANYYGPASTSTENRESLTTESLVPHSVSTTRTESVQQQRQQRRNDYYGPASIMVDNAAHYLGDANGPTPSVLEDEATISPGTQPLSPSQDDAEPVEHNHAEVDDNEDDQHDMMLYSDTFPHDSATPAPGRWDHLFLGPHYTGLFKFGEWDTYEEQSGDFNENS